MFHEAYEEEWVKPYSYEMRVRSAAEAPWSEWEPVGCISSAMEDVVNGYHTSMVTVTRHDGTQIEFRVKK